MPEPEAVQGDAALIPVANAQQRADEFASQVLSILRQEAQTKGNAETAATATILMSSALRWVLDVGGPAVARIYWGDLKQALEEGDWARKEGIPSASACCFTSRGGSNGPVLGVQPLAAQSSPPMSRPFRISAEAACVLRISISTLVSDARSAGGSAARTISGSRVSAQDLI